MQEAIALPIATTALLLTVRILERFTWGRVAWLALACVAGLGARGQLVILPIVVAGAILIDAGISALTRRDVDRRRLIAGVALVVSSIGLGLYPGFDLLGKGIAGIMEDPTAFGQVLTRSTAAMIVGVAVIPAVALFAVPGLLCSLDRRRAAFAATAVSATLVFVAYPGLKSSSLDYVFITLVEERNLIVR